MSKPKTLEKYRQALFEENGTVGLSVAEADKVERYRSIYSIWINNPSLSRARLRDFIKNEYPTLSNSQIYRDLNDIHILLGSVQNANRTHIQFIVNETLMDLIGDIKDKGKYYKELIMAVDKLAKYNQLDKDAPEPVNWGEMVDFEIEPTSDPSGLGVKSQTDEELDTLKAKLYKKAGDFEDVEFTELNQDDGEKG